MFFSINENGGKKVAKCFKNGVLQYTVPEGVTSIAPEAFGKCKRMKKLVLPQSLISFSDMSLRINRRMPDYFSGECSVNNIIIPESVEELDIDINARKYSIKKK